MALQTWIGTVDTTLSTGANWQSGTIASSDSMQFNSLATGINNSTGGWSFGSLTTIGCMSIADNFTGTKISIYDGSGGTRTISGSASRINGYAMYVGANKTFEYPRINWPRQDTFGDSDVYVGLNGLLVHSTDNVGAGLGSDKSTSTASASNAVKWGPGTWRMGPNSTDTSTLGSVTIREGVVQAGFSSAAVGRNPFGYIGTSYSPVYFNGAGTELQFGFFGTLNSFTVPNQLVFTSGGIVKSLSGFSTTLSASPGGSGTITIENGGGSLTWNAGISNPVNVAAGATLTMGASQGISGTLTGTGTIAMNSGTINSNSPSFAGTISGNFSFAGGINALSGNITGTVTPTGGILTLSGTSSGYVGDLGFVVLYITGSFAGAGGTTNLTGPGGSAYLGIDGASAGLTASRTIAMRNNSTLALFSTASVGCPVTSTVDTTNSTIVVADATACTLSGNFSTNQASGSVIVEAAVGGTLTLPGSFTSTNTGRAFALNEDTTHSPTTRPTVNIGGTIKVTGSGFSGAPATLKRGTLHLNSTSSVGVGTTLTVSGSGTTVACSSTGPYAAQITGNVSFGAGTTLRFGAP